MFTSNLMIKDSNISLGKNVLELAEKFSFNIIK